MKIIILLVLIIICYLLLSDQIIENASNIQNIGIEILNKYDNINEGNKCCKILKKIVPGNYMAYKYSISNDCDRYYNNNVRTIFSDEKVNGTTFDMEQCNENNNLFGSCRKIGGFECLDFVTKQDCDNFSYMVWSKESCNTPIPITVTYPEWKIGMNKEIKTISSELDYE